MNEIETYEDFFNKALKRSKSYLIMRSVLLLIIFLITVLDIYNFSSLGKYTLIGMGINIGNIFWICIHQVENLAEHKKLKNECKKFYDAVKYKQPLKVVS